MIKEQPFRVGDVIRLMSNETRMTVQQVHPGSPTQDPIVSVVWFDVYNNLHRASLGVDIVRKDNTDCKVIAAHAPHTDMCGTPCTGKGRM
jgi:uncharacterized protein YodC (DUF2158 family)